MEEHNITDSRWQVAWLAESRTSHTLTVRWARAHFCLAGSVCDVEEGFVFACCSLSAQGRGEGLGDVKGTHAQTTASPGMGGSV